MKSTLGGVPVSYLPSLSTPRRLRVTFSLVLALGLGAAGAWASSASACGSPCHWFSGGLSLNFGYASIEAHSLTYVQGNANHNEFCIAAETGNAGSYKDSGGDCQVFSSGAFEAAAFYSGSCCFHATIVNVGPLSSINVSTSTHYDY
jgi:hypothetical protein